MLEKKSKWGIIVEHEIKQNYLPHFLSPLSGGVGGWNLHGASCMSLHYKFIVYCTLELGNRCKCPLFAAWKSLLRCDNCKTSKEHVREYIHHMNPLSYLHHVISSAFRPSMPCPTL